MKSIQLKRNQTRLPQGKKFNFSPSVFLKKYLEYASSQEKLKVYWYLKTIIIIPCCTMVPAIILMQMSTPNYVWFIALSMSLFFVNLVAQIAELKTRITVPIYHASISIIILIPTINYILNL